jgi:hypothetical protein
MTQAEKTFAMARRMRQMARIADRPDYAEKMQQAAEDLEQRAIRLERLDQATVSPRLH